MKKGEQIPDIKEIADFLLQRPHISVTAIEKEVGLYQGQLHKAINGKMRRQLSPFIRASLTEALKPYGFTPSKREPRSAETEKKEVQPKQVTTQAPEPKKRIFLRK